MKSCSWISRISSATWSDYFNAQRRAPRIGRMIINYAWKFLLTDHFCDRHFIHHYLCTYPQNTYPARPTDRSMYPPWVWWSWLSYGSDYDAFIFHYITFMVQVMTSGWSQVIVIRVGHVVGNYVWLLFEKRSGRSDLIGLFHFHKIYLSGEQFTVYYYLIILRLT